MLPLAFATQLSTSGIGKVPSVLSKLIWSFVMEHSTAKIVKAAKAVYGIPESYNLERPRWYQIRQLEIYGTRSLIITRHRKGDREMKAIVEKGERQAPPRPSGKYLANPICIQ